jgi:dienelactone hydrolase
VQLVVHEGATHAFDRDPAGQGHHRSLRAQGRRRAVLFEFHPQAAAAARANLVAFLQRAFA